jgi:hypothetical protein
MVVVVEIMTTAIISCTQFPSFAAWQRLGRHLIYRPLHAVARLDDRIEWIRECGSCCSLASMLLKQSSVKVNATLAPRVDGALL